MTSLRPPRTLSSQHVNPRHQLTQGDVKTASELQEVQVRRVGLAASDRVDLVETQSAAVIRDRLLRHVFVFCDQNYDRLSERGMVFAAWFGLPLRWHGRQPYRSRRRGVSQRIGYHGRRRLSTPDFAGHFTMSSFSQLQALGRSIRATREEHGLDARQLSEKTGITHSRLTAIEDGQLDPDYESLLKLADALDVGMTALVERAKTIEDEEVADA
jgi:DNA-binding XRE family transcriptional regulator